MNLADIHYQDYQNHLLEMFLRDTVLIGHLNHSNISLDYGLLKYVLNNPKMHIWHHAKDLPNRYSSGVNFGISKSKKGTALRCICHLFLNLQLLCWPAVALAPFTRWCLLGFQPIPCAIASLIHNRLACLLAMGAIDVANTLI
mgnify:CR=1 FL=1